MEPPQQKFLKNVLAKKQSNAETEKQCEEKEKQKQIQTNKKGDRKKKGGKAKGKGKGKGNQKQNSTHKMQMKVKAKYPELFCGEVPTFKDGRIQTDKNGNVIFISIREYGVSTLAITLHIMSNGNNTSLKEKKEVIKQLYEFIEDLPGKNQIRRER